MAKKIFETLFGDTPEAKAAQAARDATEVRWQELLDSQKQAIQQQRTEDRRVAAFNALGNVLTTMVQPLTWGSNGATTASQPVDNRQYLESFQRAMKDNENLRNLATMDKEFQLKQAQEDEALALNELKEAAGFKRDTKRYEQRQQQELERIKARAAAKIETLETQARTWLEQAKLKRGGRAVPVSEEKKFHDKVLDEWLKLVAAYDKAVTEGNSMAVRPKDFPEYYNEKAQAAGYSVIGNSSNNNTINAPYL